MDGETGHSHVGAGPAWQRVVCCPVWLSLEALLGKLRSGSRGGNLVQTIFRGGLAGGAAPTSREGIDKACELEKGGPAQRRPLP